MKVELKLCPCGADTVTETKRPLSRLPCLDRFRLHCECGIKTGLCRTREAAVRSWNKRAEVKP